MRGGVSSDFLVFVVAVFRLQPGVLPRGRVWGIVELVLAPKPTGVPTCCAVRWHGGVDAGWKLGDRWRIRWGVAGAADRWRRRVLSEHGGLVGRDGRELLPEDSRRWRPRLAVPLRLRRADAGESVAGDGGRVGGGGRCELHRGPSDDGAGGLHSFRAAAAGVLHAQGEARRDRAHGT